MKHHITVTIAFLTLTALALISMLFVPSLGASNASESFLPIVVAMPTQTPTATPVPTQTPVPSGPRNVIKNGSFENGWSNMAPAPGNLINQQPTDWTVSWIGQGGQLWDTGATSNGVPEALHKLARQLPAHEQLGEPAALLLEGEAVYKIFHFGSSFGAQLKQTVTGLTPGDTYLLTVPVLMIQHNTSEGYSAASGVFVNGGGSWVWDVTMGDRNWYTHNIEVTVPADGVVDIEIRVLSKWTKKDYFIDNIEMVKTNSGGTTPTQTPTPDPSATATPTPVPSITPSPTTPSTGPSNPLKNGSFENGWSNMAPAPGNLINQQPTDWTVSWIPQGSRLWEFHELSNGVPEALHKLASQLPAHEQIGEPNALLLDGDAVYKIFHFGASFGAELKQTITGLTPGDQYVLTVPVLMIQHNTSEGYAAASGVFINGSGTWQWDETVGDRSWYTHTIDITVPDDGVVDIEIRVMSKWTKKDFFIDDIKMVRQ